MTELFGYIAVATGLICLLPQIVKSYRTKSTGDISLLMWVFLMLTNIFWLMHGIINDDSPLIIANSASLFMVVIMISIKIRYE